MLHGRKSKRPSRLVCDHDTDTKFALCVKRGPWISLCRGLRDLRPKSIFVLKKKKWNSRGRGCVASPFFSYASSRGLSFVVTIVAILVAQFFSLYTIYMFVKRHRVADKSPMHTKIRGKERVRYPRQVSRSATLRRIFSRSDFNRPSNYSRSFAADRFVLSMAYFYASVRDSKDIPLFMKI